MKFLSSLFAFSTSFSTLIHAQHASYKGTDEAGVKFLTSKESEAGVFQLPSGLMYKVLKKGSGKKHPKKSTPCSCHYEGTLINGKEFDSSYKRGQPTTFAPNQVRIFDSSLSYKRGQPTTFAPNQVIAGWTEIMQLMVEGDKFEMYIPASLAYGERGAGGAIPGKQALIFRMEIVKINGASVDHKGKELLHYTEEL